MMTPEEYEYLEHFGVKGMKWGKRKQRPGPSKDAKRAANIYKKGKSGSVKALTNKEIQEFNRRIDLETKYKKVTPKRSSIAIASVMGVAASVNSAIAFANTPAGRAVAKSIRQKMAWQ